MKTVCSGARATIAWMTGATRGIHGDGQGPSPANSHLPRLALDSCAILSQPARFRLRTCNAFATKASFCLGATG